jgi:hypothetical protein
MELQTISTPEDQLFRRMLDQRRVMLTGPIDGKLAERVCAQLLVLEADDPDTPVTLYLHSPGGEVDAGFAIYDTMQALRCDVATVCLGFAASMARSRPNSSRWRAGSWPSSPRSTPANQSNASPPTVTVIAGSPPKKHSRTAWSTR